MSIALPKVFWPIVIDGSNQIVIITSGGGDRTAAIATGTYYSAVTLAAALQVAIRAAHASLSAATVAVSATGYFSITNGTTFTVKVTSGSFAAATATLLGFGTSDVTDTGGTVTAPYQHGNGWYSDVAVRTDSLTIRDRSMTAKTRAESGQTKTIYSTELSSRELGFAYLKPEKTYQGYEATTYTNQAIERWWADGADRFRYWPDGTVEATYVDLVLDLETSTKFQPKRQYVKKALYELTFKCWGFVS